MSEHPYLVAVALIEQGESRLMPIGGKSLKEPIKKHDLNNENIEKIALELLVRILERSEKEPVRIANEKKSILILHIPMKSMQNELPLIKAEWISSGNTQVLLSNLKNICDEIWALSFVRYEGIQLKCI